MGFRPRGLSQRCGDDSQRPGKMTELDSFIGRFFAAFDNRQGRIPTRAEIDALFLETAVILQHAKGETVVMTVAEFAEPRVALLTSGRLREFSEWETTHSTQMFHPFAIRTSKYGKAGLLDSAPYEGSGTKLFHLVRLNGQWRIASLCWYDAEGS